MNIKELAASTPPLKTERLTLSRMLPKDARAMFSYAKKSEVTQFLTWNPHKSKKYTHDYLVFVQFQYENAAFFDWAVRDAHGKMIGTCGFTKLDEDTRCGEIGYVFSPKVWGQGYATEAAARVLKFGFEVLELNRICARFLYGNYASERVMQKLGMTSLGVVPEQIQIKGEYRTVFEYAITKEEFEEQKRGSAD